MPPSGGEEAAYPGFRKTAYGGGILRANSLIRAEESIV
jgi:hypothetical protein